MKCRCIHSFQCIPAHIIVSISADIVKAALADTVFLHSLYHFQLIILCRLIKLLKALFQALLNLLTVCPDIGGYTELFIHIS